MGQGSSRSIGHPPTDGSSAINHNATAVQEASSPLELSIPGPASASGQFQSGSGRLPREGSNLAASDDLGTSKVTTNGESQHRIARDRADLEQLSGAEGLNPASSVVSESSTPPPCRTSTFSTPTTSPAFSSSIASTSNFSPSTISSAVPSNADALAKSKSQDPSENQAISEDHARKPARIQRQTLAERLRNVRRRSYQRLSWALSGGHRSTVASSQDSSQAIPGHTAQLPEQQQSLSAPQSISSTSASNIAPSSSTSEISGEVDHSSAAPSRDPWRVMTPPPEEDLMFEERQRARRMIQEAISQLHTELARPGTSQGSLLEDSVRQEQNLEVQTSPVGRSQLLGAPQEMIMMPQTNLATLSTTDQSSEMQVDRPTQLNAGETDSLPSTSSRIFAPLPRRSASRSTSPAVTPTPVTEAIPSMFDDLFPNPTLPSTPPALPSTSAAPQPTPSMSSDASRDSMIPRRILVQGIVSSSPPPRPTSIPSSRPSAASSTRASMRGEAPDMSLWNELPGPEIVPSYTSEGNVGRHSSASLAQGTPGHDDDDAWENAISAALAQRSRDAVEDPANMLREQANLIGRLLCVAAAATAATLIPGITVNGSSVSGFGETQAGELLGGTGIPLAHAPASQRTAGSPGTPRPRSDSFGTFRTQGRAAEEGMPTSGANHESGSENVQPPSSALRNILSNALAAAFRSTPSGSTHSNPLSGTADSTRETTSSLLAETSPSTIATSAHSDMIDAPTATPTPDTETETTATSARPPQSRRSLSDPFGHGTALAIPVASLRSGVPYVSGDHHSPGTFERFLADLQADVSAAILRSRQTSGTTSPSSANTQRRSSATGLEEMRPLLDNIDEVNSEGASGQPPLPESAEPLPTVAQTSTQRQAFSFFRSYRFPPRPLAGMTGEAVTDSGTEPADPALSRPTEISRPSVPSEDDDMDGEGSSPPDTRSVPASIPAGQTTATASAGTGTSAPQIVPMLLVGVRSASLQGLTDAESNITASSPDTPRPTTSIDDPMTGSTVQHNDDPSTRNASSSHPRPSGGERDGSGTSGFVLWILGGLYPASHPIVIAPSLMGDDAMSYDELLRLAEVLGNVKPPTVSRDEIKKSDLKVVKSQTIGELYANGAVREITSERCLVCLEDYEDEEDVRILNCKHCFHQACVDTWLSTGANTCPACRTVGVSKESDTSAAPVPQPAVV